MAAACAWVTGGSGVAVRACAFRWDVVGYVDAEVAGQPGQAVGVALAHRPYPPRPGAPVDLDEQRDGLGGHRRRPEPRERLLPRVAEQHGRQGAHGRAQVVGGRDDDHALGAAAQRIGQHGEPWAAQPHARGVGLVEEHHVGVARDGA